MFVLRLYVKFKLKLKNVDYNVQTDCQVFWQIILENHNNQIRLLLITEANSIGLNWMQAGFLDILLLSYNTPLTSVYC